MLALCSENDYCGRKRTNQISLQVENKHIGQPLNAQQYKVITRNRLYRLTWANGDRTLKQLLGMISIFVFNFVMIFSNIFYPHFYEYDGNPNKLFVYINTC